VTANAPAGPFAGLAYRAHNPRWAYAPTSGEGGARHGGRFNPTGVSTLYLALDPKTAWMKAQQRMPFKAQPLTLVGYRVDCERERIIDLTDPRTHAALGIADETLACPWEDLATQGVTPPTWELAEVLIDAGNQDMNTIEFQTVAQDGVLDIPPEHRRLLDGKTVHVVLDAEAQGTGGNETLFSRLRRVRIQGPTDLSAHHDAYIVGERDV
jgi:RES domain-containing protein